MTLKLAELQLCLRVEARDIESEWAMYHAAIVEAADQTCGHKVVGACLGGNPLTCWWAPVERDAEERVLFGLWESGGSWSPSGMHQQSPGQRLGCGRSSKRPWRVTYRKLSGNSGTPSGVSGGGSSTV